MDTKKLRQKILDLAIRGKLVPQDPNDEPASVLLERIRTEKERLIKEGKIKRSKKTASEGEIEAPFEIPESWEWVRLEDFVMAITDGDHQPPPQSKTGVPFLVISDVNTGLINFSHARFVSEEYYNNLPAIRRAAKGDILFTVTGSYGITILVDTEQNFCFQRHIGLVKTICCSEWITAVLQSNWVQKYCDKIATGTAQKTVSLGHLRDFVIPVPPSPEQKRITNEIERWFTLIDELESNEGDLLKAIDKAKSKILDLAIHGKLVPQDPNDEPAIYLLKRINPKFEPIDMRECPFAIPQSWEWTSMGMCSKYESASIDPSKYKDQEFELYSVPSFETGMPDFVHGANISSSKKLVEEEDVLLCKINPHLNRTWIVEHHKKALQCIASSEWIIFRNKDINSQYLLRCFTSSYFLNLMLSNVSGVGGSLMRAQPFCVEKYLFPLPPYQEQLRIVSKTNELFAVLDSIKKNLE